MFAAVSHDAVVGVVFIDLTVNAILVGRKNYATVSAASVITVIALMLTIPSDGTVIDMLIVTILAVLVRA